MDENQVGKKRRPRRTVHRDIKPSNIMVSVQEGNVVTVKIIDLGLAKFPPDAHTESPISTPGAYLRTLIISLATTEEPAALDSYFASMAKRAISM
jgi:serine/threonine protein kinase